MTTTMTTPDSSTTTPSPNSLPTTAHGNLTYLTNYTAAAAQAVLDTQLFATQLAGQPPTFEAAISGATLSKIADGVSAIADAGASISGVAAAIASLVKDEDGNGPMDALEIAIVNSTSQPLIVTACTTQGGRATDTAQTIMPCATDMILMTASDKRFEAGNTIFGLGFVIGSGSGSSSIEVGVQLSYVDNGNPGRWAVGMNIDGAPPATPIPQNLQLLGAQFVGNTGYPSFSLYVSPIETTSGRMTLTFISTKAAS